MTQEQYEKLQKGDSLCYARIMPRFGYYEIHDVTLVTKYDDHCTVAEMKTKQSFIFNTNSMFKQLYLDRKEAVTYLKEEKEKNKNIKLYSLTKEKSTEGDE